MKDKAFESIMINKTIEDINSIEEMIRALDNIDYVQNEYLNYNGKAYDILSEAKRKLHSNIQDISKDFTESYVVLSLFERETAYWHADEMMEMAGNTNCPLCIIYYYQTYLDYCFYSTEDVAHVRYENLNELKESLFEKYKHNRNVEDSNYKNIKILKLLTLINEYERSDNKYSSDEIVEKIEKKGN